MTPNYLSMLIDAAEKKGGKGRGVKTPTYNALEAMKIESHVVRDADGVKKVWMLYPGFVTFVSKKYGWPPARAKEEWQHLDKSLSVRDHATTVDRVSGQNEYWLRIDKEFYSFMETSHEQRKEVRLQGFSGHVGTPLDIYAWPSPP